MAVSLLLAGSSYAASTLIVGELFIHAFARAVVVGAITKIGSDILGLNDEDTPALNQRGIKLNTETEDFNIPVVYGRMIIGGNIDLRDVSGGDDEYLHQILTLCEGEVDSVVDVLLDDATIFDKDVYPETIVTWPSSGRLPGELIDRTFTLSGIKITIDGNTFTEVRSSNTEVDILVDSLLSTIQADAGYSGFGWTAEANDTNGILFRGKLTTTEIDVSEVKLSYFVGINETKHIPWANSFNLTGSDDDGFEISTAVPIEKFNRGGKFGTYYLATKVGTTTQTVDSNLDAAFDYIDSNSQGKGICYAYLRLKFDRDNMFSPPTITAEIKGKKVKVWNGSSFDTEWSDNPAWCIRDYLTNTIYGQGIDEVLIDDAAFIAAADYCDGEYDTNEFYKSDNVVLGNAIFAGSYPPRYKKIAVRGDWDSAARGEALTIDSIGTYSVGFGSNVRNEEYRMAVGLNSSSSSLDPTTAEFLINITGHDYDPATPTISYQITESGSVVASGTVDSAANVPTWSYSKGSSGNIANNGFTISVTSGVLTYLHGTTLLYTSLVTPNTTYYPTVYFRDIGITGMVFSIKGKRKRYKLNGKVDTARKPYNNIKELLSSCRGMLVWSGGTYKLILDKEETGTPSFTFNEDNITGSWNISLGSKKDTFNRAKVSYLNKSRGYEADTLVIDNSTVRTDEDNGLVLENEIPLPFTTDPYDAQILGTMILNQSRSQLAVSFTAFIDATEVEVGDVVYITHSTPGWTDKKFRVLSMELMPDHNVAVSMIEYFDTNYDFTLSTVTESPAVPNDLASPYNVHTPLNVTAAIQQMKTDAAINISWDAAIGGSMIDHYEIRVVGNGAGDHDSDYRVTTKQNQYNFTGLPLGDYEFAVEAVNSHGSHSDAVSAYVEVAAPDVPNVSGLEIDLGGENGEANGTTWTGADCKIKWRPASTEYSYEINDNEPHGASSGGKDFFIKDYQVEVRNSSGVLLRTEYVTDTWYIYTQEKNLEDAVKQSATLPYRDLQFSVWTRGYFGQVSEVAAKL